MIKIKKDGFYGVKWNSKLKKYYNHKINSDDFELFTYWHEEVELEDITLFDIFKLLNNMNSVLFNAVESLCNSNVSKFLSEIFEDITDETSNVDDAYIEISKFYEVDDCESGDCKELQSEINCYGRIKGDSDGFALEFSKLNTIRHFPIVIKDKSEFFINSNATSHYKTVMTLGEFINGLLCEVCFFQSPEAREESLAELDRRCSDIKTGKEKLIPFEDIQKKIFN